MIVEHIRNITAKISVGGYALINPSWWHGSDVVIEDSKLFYISEGEVVIRINGEKHICREGDLVLIPANVRHDFFMEHGELARQYWFHFTVSSEGESIFSRYKMPLLVEVDEGERNFIISLFLRVVGDESAGDIVSQCGKLGALYDIVNYFMTRCGCEKRRSADNEIDVVLKYISENLSAPITLSTLASVACLSPNYLARKFNSRLGVPPLKYVYVMRMERAKLQLRDTQARISDIMTELGFTDAAYFSKAFKSYTGYSPRAYRKTAALQMQKIEE